MPKTIKPAGEEPRTPGKGRQDSWTVLPKHTGNPRDGMFDPTP